MKQRSFLFLFLLPLLFSAQKFEVLVSDTVSIRAVQIRNDTVWYAGSRSKIGYIPLKNPAQRKQAQASENALEFRSLALNGKYLYSISIGSPAYVYRLNTVNGLLEKVYTDSLKSAFFDALRFADSGIGIALSDPKKNGMPHVLRIKGDKICEQEIKGVRYVTGEAHFAASNSNIAVKNSRVWVATGGAAARIFTFKQSSCCRWKAYNSPLTHGTDSRGIFAIDFYDEKNGIIVGGDYKNQSDNVNNIATTVDGGKTWQVQASGKNSGYKTCVHYRPGSGGKDVIAVGDTHVELSRDGGRSWNLLSAEKNLYTCDWLDAKTVILAGKNRIIKMSVENLDQPVLK